jgi:hypothetical protein
MRADGLERVVQREVGRLCLVPGEGGGCAAAAGGFGEKGCEAQHLGFDGGFGDPPLLGAHAPSNAREAAVDRCNDLCITGRSRLLSYRYR